MKNIIYKIFKKLLKNDEIYQDFIKDIVEEDRIEFIKELVKYPVFKDITKDKCDLKNIENCILINSSFYNCKINAITNNVMEYSSISNSFIGEPITTSDIQI